MPGGIRDLTNKKIKDTYQNLLQNSASVLVNGFGDEIGSFEVKGTFKATNLIVSKSIIYDSGSTIFGDNIDDTHQFTGSVFISTSLNVDGDIAIDGTVDGVDINSFSQSVADKLYWTGSDGFITRESDVQITGSLSITGSFEDPYKGVITVAKAGAEYTSISGAYASIHDNDINNRYIIRVQPGIYTENNPIKLKDYVNILSTGEQTTTKIIAINTGSNIIELAPFAAVKGFELEGAMDAAAIYSDFGGSTYIQDCTSVDCKNGLEIVNSGSEIGVYNFNALTIFATMSNFIKVTEGKTDVRNLYVIENSQIEKILNCYDGGVINAYGLISFSNNVDDAIYVNGGEILFAHTHLKNCNNAIHITGSNSIVNARLVDIQNTKTWDLYNESDTSKINLLGIDLQYDKISTTCDFMSDGYDPFSKKWKFKGGVSIGKNGCGDIFETGEGGKYNDKISVLKYTSASDSYTDVTSGSNITLGTEMDDCVYFGDKNFYKFYGLEYNLSSSISIGTGSIIWEYYDITSGWTKVNDQNNLARYSNKYAYSFTDDLGSDHTVRLDQNIKNGIIESNVSASGWLTGSVINSISASWIRCRVSESIVTNPQFDEIFLKGNYTVIRKNGTMAYHGEARNINLISLVFGDNSGGAISANRSVSTNIVYPYWNNAMRDGLNDKIYFRFVIPDWLDTSSGISFKCELSTNKAGGGSTYTAKMHFYSSCMKCDGTFDGNNPEIIQDFDFVVGDADLANKAQCVTISNRIDVKDLGCNDKVYMCIHREGDHIEDNLTENLVMSNVVLEAYSWQNGINYNGN